MKIWFNKKGAVVFLVFVVWFVYQGVVFLLKYPDEEVIDDRRFMLDVALSDINATRDDMKIFFHQSQMRRQIVSNDNWATYFFQRNWEPSYSCDVKARFGSPGEGGKWICDPHVLLKEHCVVYSVGSNNDFSFEESIHSFNPACEIHTFDPTVKYPTNRPPYVHFHRYGVGKSDRLDVKLTKDIMQKLGHKSVSVLKVDCEGCEYDAFEGLKFSNVGQILVEVHFTRGPMEIHRLFRLLTDHGFAIFSKESNLYANMYALSWAMEYGLVKL